MLFCLAHELGKRIPEMMQMTVQEYVHWIAYLRMLEKRQRRGKP